MTKNIRPLPKTKNNRLEKTNPNRQIYAFLTVAKQRNQIMQTVWTNQSKVYEIK